MAAISSLRSPPPPSTSTLWDIDDESKHGQYMATRGRLFNNEYFSAPLHYNHNCYTDEKFTDHAELRVCNPSDESFQYGKNRLSDILANGLVVPTELKITPFDEKTIRKFYMEEEKLQSLHPGQHVWNQLTCLHESWRNNRIRGYTWMPTDGDWYKHNVLHDGVYAPIPIFGSKGSPNSIELIMMFYKNKLFGKSTLLHIIALIAVHAWCVINGRYLVYNPQPPNGYNGSYPSTLTIIYQQKDTKFKASEIIVDGTTHTKRDGDDIYDESIDLYHLATITSLTDFAYYTTIRVCRHFYKYVPINSGRNTEQNANNNNNNKKRKRTSPGTSETIHGWFWFRLYTNFTAWRNTSRFVQHPIYDIFNITRKSWEMVETSKDQTLHCHSKHIFEIRSAQLYAIKYEYKSVYIHYLFPVLYSHVYSTTPGVPVIRPVSTSYYDSVIRFCWDVVSFSSKTIKDELINGSGKILEILNREISRRKDIDGIVAIRPYKIKPKKLPTSSLISTKKKKKKILAATINNPKVSIKSQCEWLFNSRREYLVKGDFVSATRYAPFISPRRIRYLFTFNTKKLFLAPPAPVLWKSTTETKLQRDSIDSSSEMNMEYMNPMKYSCDESSVSSMESPYFEWCVKNGQVLFNIDRVAVLERLAHWPIIKTGTNIDEKKIGSVHMGYRAPIKVCEVNGHVLWIYTIKMEHGTDVKMLPLECQTYIASVSTTEGRGSSEYILYLLLCSISVRHVDVIASMCDLYGIAAIDNGGTEKRNTQFLSDLSNGEKLYHSRMLSMIHQRGDSKYSQIIGDGIAAIDRFYNDDKKFSFKDVINHHDITARMPDQLEMDDRWKWHSISRDQIDDGMYMRIMQHLYSNIWLPILYYQRMREMEHYQYIQARTMDGREKRWKDVHDNHNEGMLLAEAETIMEHTKRSLETSDHDILIRKMRDYKGGNSGIDCYLQLIVNSLSRSNASRLKYNNLLTEAKEVLINNGSGVIGSVIASSSSSSSAIASYISVEVSTPLRVYIMHNVIHYIETTRTSNLPPSMLIHFYDQLQSDIPYINHKRTSSSSVLLSPDQRLVGILKEIQSTRPNFKEGIHKSIISLESRNEYQLKMIKLSYMKASK